jgi:hypothetical protein
MVDDGDVRGFRVFVFFVSSLYFLFLFEGHTSLIAYRPPVILQPSQPAIEILDFSQKATATMVTTLKGRLYACVASFLLLSFIRPSDASFAFSLEAGDEECYVIHIPATGGSIIT